MCLGHATYSMTRLFISRYILIKHVIFMNGLPDYLEHRNIGAFIGDEFYGCPMQADDVALIALTKNDLDNMMRISYEYSCRWRYSLNPSKTVVLVFGESRTQNKRLRKTRQWRLGNEPVTEATEHKHVGIILSSLFNHTERTLTASRKLRATFFSIIGAGVSPSNTSPLTSLKLFNCICIPRALYGCELWSTLTFTDMQMIETTYRFCIKYFQGLPKRTRTAIALGAIGTSNAEAVIDKCKLLFLRRLCTAPLHSRIKSLFLKRLMHYKYNINSRKTGYINNIMRLLRKYSLTNFVEDYITDGIFVPKLIWKRLVVRNIKMYAEKQWLDVVTYETGFEHFTAIHNNCSKPLKLWKASARFPQNLPQLTHFVRLCVRANSIYVCNLCNRQCKDLNVHLFCECQNVTHIREKFWDFIANNFDIELEVELHNLTDTDFVYSLFGANLNFFSESANHHLFFLKSSACLWYPALKYLFP